MKYNQSLIDTITLTGGGAYEIVARSHYEMIDITGTPSALSSGILITEQERLGQADEGLTVMFRYTARVTLNGQPFSVLGKQLTQQQASQDNIIIAVFNGTAFEVIILPNDGDLAGRLLEVEDTELDASGGTITLNPLKDGDIQIFTGNYTLSSSWTITGSAAPSDRSSFIILYKATLTVGGNNVTIFGTQLTDAQALAGNSIIFAYYSNSLSSWQSILLNHDAFFADQALTQGSILTGQSGGLAGELALGDAEIPIGDGTDINAVTISGDVAIANDGTATIQNDAVENAMIADSEIGVSKLSYKDDDEAGGSGTVTNGIMAVKKLQINTSLLDGVLNNLFPVKDGDIILGCKIIVKTAAGIAGTIDIGIDTSVTGGLGVVDGIMVDVDGNDDTKIYTTEDTTKAYVGISLAKGFYEAQGDGWVTIQSSTDLSASAIEAYAYLYFLPY